MKKPLLAVKDSVQITGTTANAYSLQLKLLIREIDDLEIEEITLNLLKKYLVGQSIRLKPSSLGHRTRFVRSLFRFAFEEGHISSNPSRKLREPKTEKRIPKFLIENVLLICKRTFAITEQRFSFYYKKSTNE